MTLPALEHAERRGRSRPGAKRRTAAGSLRQAILRRLDASKRIRWPSSRYRADPVAFFREILGVDPWSKQVEIIEAVRDHARVAVSSGHKVSKSHTAAGLALWFYCSFDDARAVMSSTTSRQVDQILWRELKMMRARGGRCIDCKRTDPDGRATRPCPHSAVIDGDAGELARTGLKSEDFREVVGFTAREAEAVAGISGKHLLYIIDEASGVPDEIFEALEGNRAGGARIVMLSNPTRTTGEFFDAFHSKADFYKTITVSSEETPNVVEGREVIPGLATRAWIDEKKAEWGEDSPLYSVRVKGKHATREDGKIFSIHTIEQAEQRWHETPESGRLFIGVDPAGPSGSGDETAFAVRRGLKLLALTAMRGLDEEQHLVQILAMCARYSLPRETPVVVYDREGEVGSKLQVHINRFLEEKAALFEAVSVRASDAAVRQPGVYGRMRDELTANLEQWIRDGGAIVEDTKLAGEMHSLNWEQQVNGRLKVTRKDKLRKELGRSPDRYDALCLAVWEPLSLQDDVPVSAPASARAGIVDRGDEDGARPLMDPYAGAAAWR